MVLKSAGARLHRALRVRLRSLRLILNRWGAMIGVQIGVQRVMICVWYSTLLAALRRQNHITHSFEYLLSTFYVPDTIRDVGKIAVNQLA